MSNQVRCPPEETLEFRREMVEQDFLTGKTCMTCFYCDSDDKMGLDSVCRKNPPLLGDQGSWETLTRLWPPVDMKQDWCGEYREAIPIIDLENHLDPPKEQE